ncbi:hypothetical protein [Paucilactobacillus kaifaensis]|uniref:hypothetical protein n=1 Tax=Paucilactobacillus kaifaensis TaxID=2559921 RepID=UPI0010F479B4|nr:hypothetical protein [Paucilactobacillus kaifaensis]
MPNSNTTPIKEQNSVRTTKWAKPEGKWSGQKKYPHGQYVKLTVTFLKNKQYQLVESNTVSQCWTRTYFGSYKRDENQLFFTPQKIIVRTFATKADMKNGNSSAQEQISQEQFHKQFGNQQISKLKLEQQQIKIEHDHEKVILHSKD